VATAVVSADAPALEVPDVVSEQTPTAMAGDDLAASLLGTIQTALLSDPSDYSVASDRSIEVHPLETLGHYADWLGIRTQRLRDINGLSFRTPVDVGQRIKLDLSTVDPQSFEDKRIAFHRAQQDTFFRENIISGVTEHVVARGESIWVLALREYDVPVWLFRQYNPEVELHNVQPGTTVRFPVLTSVDRT
jgi:membrane-bound lytic murein transglycosylase D